MAAGDGRATVAPADLALRRFVQTVVDANPRVKAAQSALEASKSYRDAASRPFYNPEFEAGLEKTHETRYTLGIGYTIDWGGKGRARTALAESERRVAKADAAEALVELRRRERRPDPTLSVAGGKEAGVPLAVAELSIPLPLFNRFKDEVNAAAAEHRAARQAGEDVSQRARARLISTMERYQRVRVAWGDWQKTGQASLARQGEQLQRLGEAGDISTTDYLVQVGQTLDVRESALDLRESLWRAWLEWLSASGRIDDWIGYGVGR